MKENNHTNEARTANNGLTLYDKMTINPEKERQKEDERNSDARKQE